MSRIINVRVKSAVAFMDLAILKLALQDCIQARQGSWITNVHDTYGNPTRIEVGIKTAAFERGIGFVKVGDRFEARADFYGKNTQGQALLNEITRNYQKQANLAVLRELNYIPTVTAEKTQQGERIKLMARQY